MASLTTSKLRASICRILGEVLKTVRRGRKLMIIPLDEDPPNKLDNLVERADLYRYFHQLIAVHGAVLEKL